MILLLSQTDWDNLKDILEGAALLIAFLALLWFFAKGLK